MDKLKPCPFCGGNNIHTDYRIFEKSSSIVYEIECLSCSTVQATFSKWGIDTDKEFNSVKEKAYSRWNTRKFKEE